MLPRGSALTVLVLVCIATALCRCDDIRNNPAVDRLSRDAHEQLDSAKQAVQDLGPQAKDLGNTTTEEIAKLFSYEYHVFELDRESTPLEIETKLSAMGKERWECSHIEPSQSKIRFMCKRRPESYLRYLPRFFLFS